MLNNGAKILLIAAWADIAIIWRYTTATFLMKIGRPPIEK